MTYELLHNQSHDCRRHDRRCGASRAQRTEQAWFWRPHQIDIKATLKKKLDVEMPAYRILGACNPGMAHQAIGIEPRVGAMLPCNVILREVEGGVEVSAVDPLASMQAIDNPALRSVAGQVRDLLDKALIAV